jgi:hypothetical protein
MPEIMHRELMAGLPPTVKLESPHVTLNVKIINFSSGI